MYPVLYLERSDFTDNGSIKSELLDNKPALVMIQAGFCGHCTHAKPAFQELANAGDINCMTVQTDGERQSERDIAPILNKIYPGFTGFPSYLLITPDGKRIAYNDGDRSEAALRSFVHKNSR
jgi:thiol-disulfide isomerase/thioredoxin